MATVLVKVAAALALLGVMWFLPMWAALLLALVGLPFIGRLNVAPKVALRSVAGLDTCTRSNMSRACPFHSAVSAAPGTSNALSPLTAR